MNHETRNIIIDPSLSGDQTARTMSPNVSRPFLWGALAVAALVALFILFSTGCSDDDTDSKSDDKAAEIAQCKAMSDAFQKCIGWDSMNTTLKEAKAECEKADFDNYDRCMFDCEALSADCEVLTTCFDEC